MRWVRRWAADLIYVLLRVAASAEHVARDGGRNGERKRGVAILARGACEGAVGGDALVVRVCRGVWGWSDSVHRGVSHAGSRVLGRGPAWDFWLYPRGEVAGG